MKQDEQNSDRNIALFGVGTMGRIILEKLLKNGYTVFAYDPFPIARDFIKNTSAHLMDKIADAAKQADVCIMSLPNSKIVLDTVGGIEGIAANSTKGTFILDTSTVDPKTSKKASSIAQEYDLNYLDAPLLGRPASPEGWVSPVGGESAHYKKVQVIIESYVSRSIHVGPLGSGNTLKLLNQMMFSTINCITSEVMAICSQTELDPAMLYDLVANSGASTVSGLFKEVGRKICENNFSPEFTVKLLAKDSQLAQEMTIDYQAPSLLLNTVNFVNSLAISKGYGDDDTSAIYKTYMEIYAGKDTISEI